MSEINNIQEIKTSQSKKFERRLDAFGWGLFFIWIGVAFLADVGWGVGFLGIGVIILGSLATREYLSESACSKPTNERCRKDLISN